jgi:polyphosphate kinase 2 (PPK2 family)
MQSIVNFEKHISNNGTIVLKFLLNLSKEEQRQRLLRRLEKPKHNWKFSPGDLKERQLWDKYQNCYQELITKTSQPQAPWYIVPSDNKPLARLLLAQTLLQTLEQYTNIAYPTLDTKIKENIDGYKTQLNSEK